MFSKFVSATPNGFPDKTEFDTAIPKVPSVSTEPAKSAPQTIKQTMPHNMPDFNFGMTLLALHTTHFIRTLMQIPSVANPSNQYPTFMTWKKSSISLDA